MQVKDIEVTVSEGEVTVSGYVGYANHTQVAVNCGDLDEKGVHKVVARFVDESRGRVVLPKAGRISGTYKHGLSNERPRVVVQISIDD